MWKGCGHLRNWYPNVCPKGRNNSTLRFNEIVIFVRRDAWNRGPKTARNDLNGHNFPLYINETDSCEM